MYTTDEEGDSVAFQSKLTGAGANDMCNMQELTKDTILALLRDRFKKEIVYTCVTTHTRRRPQPLTSSPPTHPPYTPDAFSPPLLLPE